ncbi:nuclear transport factor 2 family protein [Mucilaginibacter gossypii]|uniref:nuclear transport factor 2 family protein n=1 Tax=Mucilaginibacter gossypii TaxID=551996 RepID=UPI000DCB5CDD|nr:MULTISPECIES: nuclear transport factor 2 family protein [Mucilaginibacter]QTE39703.1 nuclear transport factor 2 family protein [Mucilaginibacter gossypii]RAV54080.1 nuclear transport factor 2 family protein [Mucilaginibacter rubeus]
MKKSTYTLFIIGFAAILSASVANAQTKAFKPKDQQLFNTIAHMDSVMFNAFNGRNLEVMKTLFAPDVEFYNDGKGLTDYDGTMAGFKGIFENKQAADLRRDLLKETLEVYPMPGFGAIEMGTHRFTHTENGQPVIGLMKFVHIWQYKDGQWKVTRVVSVGH